VGGDILVVNNTNFFPSFGHRNGIELDQALSVSMLHLECRKSVLQENLSQIQIFEGECFVCSISCQ
jgi:hypothetical protein